MIDRIFDFYRCPCDCVFLDPMGHETRSRILHISMRRAIIGTHAEFPLHLVVGVVLDFEMGPEVELKARVEGSGANGLFLQLLHPDKDSENALQTLLVEYSTRERCEDDEPEDFDPEDRLTTDEIAELAGSDEDRELRSTILRRTRTVRSQDLAAAHQKVRVMNMSSVTELIHEAVDEALETVGRRIDQQDREQLLQEAEEAFQERLKDMQAEKDGLLAKASRLEEQLGRAKNVLDDERKKEVRANQFTVSDAGMEELEDRLERIFKRVVGSDGVTEDVQSDMRAVISSLLDEERERQREREQKAHNEMIQLLEHKVGRLAQALDDASRERDAERHRANALEAMGGGVSGVKLTSQLGEDPDKGRKLALLKELIADNREVRSHMGLGPSNAEMNDPKKNEAGGGRPNVLASIAQGGNDEVPSGVKKIAVVRATPPPLEVSP